MQKKKAKEFIAEKKLKDLDWRFSSKTKYYSVNHIVN